MTDPTVMEGALSRPLMERQYFTDEGRYSGFTTVQVGVETVRVRLTIRTDLLVALLGEKAARNRSGKAQALGGSIRTQVLERILTAGRRPGCWKPTP